MLGIIIIIIKVTDSLTCTFCKVEIETPVHLFYECDFTSKLRQELVERISNQFCVQFGDFTRKRVMLGFIQDWKGPNRTLLNHLVLLYKRYIYLQKMKEPTLALEGLLSFIRYIKNIELKIAKQNNRETFHYQKWSPIEAIL